MRPITATVFGLALALTAGNAVARNVSYKLPIADAVANAAAKDLLGGFVLNWADQKPATSFTDLGVLLISKGKARIAHRAEEMACREAFLDSLQDLRQQVVRAGGNAAIAVVSDFKGHSFESQTLYDCHAGHADVYVTLKGTAAKITR
jgi:hypothetical protein